MYETVKFSRPEGIALPAGFKVGCCTEWNLIEDSEDPAQVYMTVYNMHEGEFDEVGTHFLKSDLQEIVAMFNDKLDTSLDLNPSTGSDPAPVMTQEEFEVELAKLPPLASN